MLLEGAWAYAATEVGNNMERTMPPTLRASGVFVASAAAIVLASPAVAELLEAEFDKMVAVRSSFAPASGADEVRWAISVYRSGRCSAIVFAIC